MKKNLSRLLRPRSIAVIGGNWAESAIKQCQRMGYDGDILPINARRKTMGDIDCFACVEDLPIIPDAAFVGVNREATVDVITALSKMECGGAVCFASGFAEADKDHLQQKLVNAAGNMPILGPNCYGLINYLDGALLWPDQHGGKREAWGAAIIGQSSNILINISSQRRGLPIAYMAAAGNQAQTTMADIARGILEDARVRAIGFYIEGIADAVDFADMAAQAAKQGIPMAAIKSGKSPEASLAATSHTAALTGSGAASSAFLAQCKIAEAQTIAEWLEMLKLFCAHGTSGGRRIMSLSCSGGEAGHVADLAINRRLHWLPPPPKQHKAFVECLGPLPRISNPLDYHTFIWHDSEALERAYSTALRCDNDLTMLVYDFPRDDRCAQEDWRLPLNAFRKAVKNTGGRAAVTATLAENMPETIASQLLADGIAPLCGLSEALAAMEAAADIAERDITNWRPLSVVHHTAQHNQRWSDEFLGKQWLTRHGICCPQGRRANTPPAAGEAARSMPFSAFVVKSLGIEHKSDVGGVMVDIPSSQVEAVAAAMPQGKGFLVEEMLKDAVVELLLGARRDVVYGATLTIGMGGIYAEMLNDTQTLILPITDEDISAMLSRLRCFPLLGGYRGAAVADVKAIIKTAQVIANIIALDDSISEIEINPLFVFAEGVCAADVLINKGENKT